MTNLEVMIYRVAWRMASIDGDLSANEALLLDLLGKDLGIEGDEVETLKQEAEHIDYTMLRKLFPEHQDRRRLMETACLLAAADGKPDPAEWKLAVKLAEHLNLDREEVQGCAARARDRLRAVGQEHDLGAEIRENLKKQGLID